MRKVIMFNRISIDGFFAGPKGEIDWFVQDSEGLKLVKAKTLGLGVVLLGYQPAGSAQ